MSNPTEVLEFLEMEKQVAITVAVEDIKLLVTKVKYELDHLVRVIEAGTRK
jgi:hypothetical protein